MSMLVYKRKTKIRHVNHNLANIFNAKNFKYGERKNEFNKQAKSCAKQKNGKFHKNARCTQSGVLIVCCCAVPVCCCCVLLRVWCVCCVLCVFCCVCVVCVLCVCVSVVVVCVVVFCCVLCVHKTFEINFHIFPFPITWLSLQFHLQSFSSRT